MPIEKAYTIYFEPVTVRARNQKEAEKIAKKNIKEYPLIEYVLKENW